MSRQKDGGWILPSVIDPTERVCVQLYIPNDLYHRMAFWGALQELCYWFNWQRDDQQTASQVANVWKAVIQDANARANSADPCPGDCEGMIDNIRVVGCELQVMYSGSTLWTPIGDFSACGAQGPIGPVGPVGPQGPAGVCPDECQVGPDAPGGIADPVPGPGMTNQDAACSIAKALTQTVVDMATEVYDQTLSAAPVALALTAVGGIALLGMGGLVLGTLALVIEGVTIQSAQARKDAVIAAGEDIMCALLCSLPDDNSIDRATLDAWALDVAAMTFLGCGDVASIITALYVKEARIAAQIAATTPKTGCDDCECTGDYDVTFDFRTGLHGWVFATDEGGDKGYQDATRELVSRWHLDSQNGWAQRLNVSRAALGATGCTEIVITGYTDRQVNSPDFNVQISGVNHYYTPAPGAFEYHITNIATITQVLFAFYPLPNEAGEFEHLSIESIRFIGNGTPPGGA